MNFISDIRMSIRSHSLELRLYPSTIWRILLTILIYISTRSNWFNDWSGKTIITVIGVLNEANFWLSKYVNRQNCCRCSTPQPQEIYEVPLHTKNCTKLCGLYNEASFVLISLKISRRENYCQWRPLQNK